MDPNDYREDDLLSPGEVAQIFRVDAKTVSRWARTGKLSSIRTPGGHRRYFAREVAQMVSANTEQAQES